MSTKLGTLTLDLVTKIGQFIDPLDKAEKKATSSSKKIGDSFDGIGSLASKAAPMIAGLAGTITGLAASYITLDKIIDAQRTYDKQIAGLETATKSAENAQEAYAALSKFAKETPYGMDQAVDAFTKLVNLGLTPSERALMSYGNTAASMGKDLIQFIEAVADASTGEFERLKEFGIKASKQGDDVAFTFQGTTTKIKNNAAAIEEYLTKIGENEFAGSMAKRMDSLDGDLANLEDSWNDLYIATSKAGVGEAVRDATVLASDSVQGLTNLVSSGAIESALGGMGKAFSIFGGDAKSEMKGIADTFGLTSDYLVEKWEATIEELNMLGNTWTLLRSWVQKASVSVAASIDMVSDPFNKKTSNASKQTAWESSMQAIDDEAIGRWNAVSKGIGEAEKKYNDYMASQAKGNKDSNDALAKYKIKAKDAGDTATEATQKANKELEKQKKLIEGLGSGLVSNANLKGLNIKSAESIAGGRTRGYTAEFAQLANSALGDSINRFTAFNDSYHKGTNSKHATGNAFDFTLKDAKQAQQAVSVLEDVAKRYGYSIKILDEYKDPSKRATGGHLHVSVLGKNATEAWKDIQDEVGIIGKGYDSALKLDEEMSKKRLSIYKAYATDLQKIELENADAIKEIEAAYTVDDSNRQKYLDLQKLVYQKDLEAFKKTQLQKQYEELSSLKSMQSQIQGLSAGSDDIFAKATMSPQDYARWSFKNDRDNAKKGLRDDLTSTEQNITTSEVYKTDDDRYQALLEAHKNYRTGMMALDVQYNQNLQQLQNQTQAASLAGYGAMFGMMGSMLEAYGDKESSSYKIAFAMQKAFVLSSALLNAKGAVLAAWNDPSNTTFWSKAAAAAATIVETNDLMSAIQGVALTGMAHDGIASIPEEGTWLLNKGERVLNPQDNKAFTEMMKNGGTSNGDVHISVQVTDAGVQTQSNASDQKQLGQLIGNAVRVVIMQEKRQGGLLAK